MIVPNLDLQLQGYSGRMKIIVIGLGCLREGGVHQSLGEITSPALFRLELSPDLSCPRGHDETAKVLEINGQEPLTMISSNVEWNWFPLSTSSLIVDSISPS
ncbi:hypothetical protein Tco_0326910 [Tanacetum coccineum]